MARRSAGSQSHVLLAVAAVTLLAATLVTALGLLVPATEQAGLRSALAALPASEARLSATIVQSSRPLEQTRRALDASIASVLGDAGTATGTTAAYASFTPAQLPSPVPVYASFAELDAIRDHARLTAGAWPASGSGAAGQVDVALPQTAADAFGLGVGARIVTGTGTALVTARITGLYAATDPSSTFWDLDALHGTGDDPEFPKPDTSYYVQTHGIGPLVAGRGGLDGAGIPLQVIVADYDPSFPRARVDGLEPLLGRLADADGTVSDDLAGDGVVALDTRAADAVGAVATAIGTTRTTVVIVSLLLVVLAVAAIAQPARLLREARTGERRLMRARGASSGRIRLQALLEALVLAAAVTALAPPLAALAVVGLQGVLGVQSGALQLPAFAWTLAAAVALCAVAVLVGPLLVGRAEDEPGGSEGRADRVGGAARSGLDLAVAVLAAVAFWQLLAQAPTGQTSAGQATTGQGPAAQVSLTPNPVLAVAPALVLLAGALLAARLLPVVARAVDVIAGRARGVIASLAAWEVARRTRQATGAVLVLTLALAAGTFALSFLATWQQSQDDQAAVALGAPVRATVPNADADASARADEPGRADANAASATDTAVESRTGTTPASAMGTTAASGTDATAASATDAPAASGNVGRAPVGVPVLRRSAVVTLPDTDGSSQGPVAAQVLGLLPRARDLIAAGAPGRAGGAEVRELLSASRSGLDADVGAAGTIPAGTSALALTLRAGVAGLAALSVQPRLLLQDATGVLLTVEFDPVAADTTEQTTTATVRGLAGDARIVGVQLVLGGDPAAGELDRRRTIPVVLERLGAGDSADAASAASVSAPLSLQAPDWTAFSDGDQRDGPGLAAGPAGAWLELDPTLQQDVRSNTITVAAVGWQQVVSVGGVLQRSLAAQFDDPPPLSLNARIGSRSVPLTLRGTVDVVPGSSTSAQLQTLAGGVGTAEGSSTVGVDGVALQRFLAQQGDALDPPTEWWEAAGTSGPLGLAHPDAKSLTSDQIAARVRVAPVRIATPAALQLAVLAAAVLAAAGFAAHLAATLRARRLELAQHRAIGLSWRSIAALIALEALLLGLLGTVFGVAIGLLLALAAGPLLGVTPTGTAPVPSIEIVVPWLGVVALVLVVAVVVPLIAAALLRTQQRTDPSLLLRQGGAS